MARYHARRTKAEEELRESDRLLRTFYDQGLVGLAITSPDKGWIRINQYL